MATVRDKKTIESSRIKDRQSFVFNWLSTPLQEKANGKGNDISARIEDILEELQGERSWTDMKIRLK